MSAKDKILTAYETILINQGEKSATMDAVAKAAGVSKGGLLYHFPSKEAMATGLIKRFTALSEEDLTLMKEAPEGPAAYYSKVSIYEDNAFDRALVAVSRLAQESNAAASLALRESQEKVTQLITAEVGDADTARAIVLLADGMYYNAAFMGTTQTNESSKEGDLRILHKAVQALKAGVKPASAPER